MRTRHHAATGRTRPWRALGALIGLVAALALSGCAGETYPTPPYKSRPDFDTRNQTPATTAPLSGYVYVADSLTIDPQTQRPEGYALLPGDEGRVTVRVAGTTGETRVVPIRDGAYTVPDLPVGVMLEVVASYPGYSSRKQQVQIVLPAGRRLNFDHVPGGTDTMLIRLKDPPSS